MNFSNISQEIIKKIKNSSYIIISSHQHPDPDALGSLMAFREFLSSLGKNFQIVLEEDIKNEFFQKRIFFSRSSEIDWESADLLISLDSGDMERLDAFLPLQQKFSVINIDHHFSNKFFGDINLVQTTASSTTEIITRFFQEIDFSFSQETATGLLFGLVTDTDNFSNKGTSPYAFSIASFLLKKGANLAKVNFFNKKNNKKEVLQIWGKAFSRLRGNNKLGIVYTAISQEELSLACQLGAEEKMEEMVNFLNILKDCRVVMVLKEQKDGIRVSLRTNKENVDVSRLALLFGGGGHKKAAGFKINSRLDKIEALDSAS